MTEAELKLLRANAKALAAEVLLEMVCRKVQASQPTFLPSLLQTGNQWLKTELSKMAFPEYPPEYSDLYAQEMREAVATLFEQMKKWS